jgi:hypothetical protein
MFPRLAGFSTEDVEIDIVQTSRVGEGPVLALYTVKDGDIMPGSKP